MHSERFEEAFRQLCLSIDLDPPANMEEIMSLKVGPYVCTFSEHPADFMLMFIEIEPLADAPIAEQNLHCQDVCKPVMGRDPLSKSDILWNRQPLMHLDRAQIHHQFSVLVAAAQALSGLDR